MSGINSLGGTSPEGRRQRVRASDPTHQPWASETVGIYSRKNSPRVNPSRMSSAIMVQTESQFLRRSAPARRPVYLYVNCASCPYHFELEQFVGQNRSRWRH